MAFHPYVKVKNQHKNFNFSLEHHPSMNENVIKTTFRIFKKQIKGFETYQKKLLNKSSND